MAYNWPIGSGGAAQRKPGNQRKASGQPQERGAGALEPEEHEQGGDTHAAIHEHLRSMHEATGHAHTHVEHHGDGTHTSHHVDESGNVSGPHEHESTEALNEHIAQTAGDGEEGGDEDEEFA